MRLAAGDLYAALVQILIKIRVFLMGQAFHSLLNIGIFQAGIQLVPVKIGTGTNRISQGHREDFEILENNRIEIYNTLFGVCLNVFAVDENFAVGHIIQAAHQLDKGGFAAAVPAHHGQMAAVLNFNAHILQGILICARIFERHIFELDLKSVTVQGPGTVLLAVCALYNLKINPSQRQDLRQLAQRVSNEHNTVYDLHKSATVHHQRTNVKQPQIALDPDKNIHAKRNKGTHHRNDGAGFCGAHGNLLQRFFAVSKNLFRCDLADQVLLFV